MTSLRDPLTLPCGQVLPNRIMKAALSESGSATSKTLPTSESTGYTRAGAKVATV